MLTMVSAMERARRLYAARDGGGRRRGGAHLDEFVDRARRAASVLDGLGVGPGERYAILSRNTFRNAELMHAGYWSGRVPVPVNVRLAGPETRHILDDSDCRLLVVDEALSELAGADELAPWRGRSLLVAPQYEALLARAAPPRRMKRKRTTPRSSSIPAAPPGGPRAYRSATATCSPTASNARSPSAPGPTTCSSTPRRCSTRPTCWGPPIHCRARRTCSCPSSRRNRCCGRWSAMA